MKKFVSLIIVFAIVSTLAACAKTAESSGKTNSLGGSSVKSTATSTSNSVNSSADVTNIDSCWKLKATKLFETSDFISFSSSGVFIIPGIMNKDLKTAEGKAYAANSTEADRAAYRKMPKYTYGGKMLDKSGKEVTLPKDVVIQAHNQNYTEIYVYNTTTKLYGGINGKGVYINECKYKSLVDLQLKTDPFEYNVSTDHGKNIIVDKSGKAVCKVPEVLGEGYVDFPYCDGKTAYFSFTDKASGKTGLMDPTGKIVLPCKYMYIEPFKNGYGNAAGEGKIGNLINSKAETVFPDGYDGIDSFDIDYNLVSVVVTKNKKDNYGIVNLKNEILIPLKYSRVYYFGDGIIGVVDDKKVTTVYQVSK